MVRLMVLTLLNCKVCGIHNTLRGGCEHATSTMSGGNTTTYTPHLTLPSSPCSWLLLLTGPGMFLVCKKAAFFGHSTFLLLTQNPCLVLQLPGHNKVFKFSFIS